MFANYFADRYFPPRYFGNVGEDPPAPPASTGGYPMWQSAVNTFLLWVLYDVS